MTATGTRPRFLSVRPCSSKPLRSGWPMSAMRVAIRLNRPAPTTPPAKFLNSSKAGCLLHSRRKEDPAGEQPAGIDCLLKANPDRASLGTAGVGAQPHLAGLLFHRKIEP